MKSLKMKLTTAFIMVAFAIAILIVGIWAAETQTITMEGSVNFEIADKSLYMKDVRIQMDNNSDSTSIDDFMPGYINGDFKMNLGSLTNNYGSFALYFDIVNTVDETGQSFYYSPSVTCEQDGISVQVSGAIDKGTATADTVATADISGTIKLVVTNTTDTLVDLSKIKITISQAEVYTDFVFDDHGTLLSYTGTDTNVIIPSSYAMIGEPTEMTIDIQSDISSNSMTLMQMTNFTYIYDGQEMFFESMDKLFEYTNNELPQTPCQFVYNDYSNVIFIENNDIPVVAIQGAFFMNTTIQEVYIPEGVINIGYGAFVMTGLHSVNIPNSVESIGYGAFSECTSLAFVTINENSQLEYIGDHVFENCANLISINLPQGLISIGYSAFRYTSLTSITIPQSVNSIQRWAFAFCDNLNSIVFEDIEGWYQTDNSGNYIEDLDVSDPNANASFLKSPGSSQYEDGYLLRK